MNRTLYIALVGLLATFLPAHAEPVTLDRIVAVVNKTAITEHDLDQQITSVEHNMARQKMSSPPMDVLRRQVLDHMVNERVLIDYGEDTGVRIDDTQIDRAIERIAKQNKMSVPQFKAALEHDGETFNQFRQQISHEMLTQRLRERDVDGKVYVTDTEVDQYLATHKNDAQAGKEYHLAQILLAIPENASPDVISAKQKRAAEAAQAIASGKSFAEVAATYSEAPDALSGGDIGWRAAGRLPPLFLDAVAKLHDGEVTPVIRSPAGFHLLKLIEHRNQNAKQIITQTHAEHILIKVNELTSESEAKTRIEEVRARILAGAKFEEQAKLYSEDASASKGGDLGWISPGDTVPQFEQAMNALKPDEVSEPVRSPFGWHLIKVLQRRDQDVTKDRERLRVRNELRERKADERYETWVSQLRDRAFVKLHLDDN